jgi:hypothetical protein
MIPPDYNPEFKFQFNFPKPLAIGSWGLYNLGINGAVRYGTSKDTVNLVAKNPKKAEFAIKKQLSEDFTIKGGLKLDEQALKDFANSIKSGVGVGLKTFFKKLFSLETRYKLLKITDNWEVNFGAQLDLCPFFFLIKGVSQYPSYCKFMEQQIDFTYVIELKFSFNLTPQGWSIVIRHIGLELLKKGLTKLGPRFINIVESPVLKRWFHPVVAAVTLSYLHLEYFSEYVCKVHIAGDWDALASWYSKSYVDTVFNEFWKYRDDYNTIIYSKYTNDMNKIKNNLIEAAKKDAYNDAEIFANKIWGRAEVSSMTKDKILEAFSYSFLGNQEHPEIIKSKLKTDVRIAFLARVEKPKKSEPVINYKLVNKIARAPLFWWL